MKKYFIGICIIITIATLFIGCEKSLNNANSTTNSKQVFNEERAKSDSKEQLEKLLNSNENGSIIAKNTETNKIKDFINNNLKDYLTKDYINDVTNQLSVESFFPSNNTFYLTGYSDKSTNKISEISDDISFYNTYKIDSPTVNVEKETLLYRLSAKDSKGCCTVDVLMKNEDGVWKVYKVGSLIIN